MKTLVSLLALFCAPMLLGAVAAPPAVSPSASEIDLGSVVPGAMTGASSALSVLVSPSAPWTLTVVLEPVGGFVSASEVISIRRAGGVWVDLPLSLPLPIASGDASAAGVIVPLEIRASATFDSRPGARTFRLRFATSASVDDLARVRLVYSVPALAQVENDPRPFASPQVNPARSGVYPYESRSYSVLSNVPWVLDATLNMAPLARGRTDALPDGTLVVLDDTGVVRPLAPSQPLAIASGDPTGQRARLCHFQLAINVDGRLLIGGDYTAEVVVAARPASEPSAGAAPGFTR